MEVIVASNSQLGQYLAELDASENKSMSHLPSATQKRSIHRTSPVAQDWILLRLMQSLRHRVELVALRHLLPYLCLYHQTILEEIEDASKIFTKSKEPLDSRAKWLTQHIPIVEVFRGVKVATDGAWEGRAAIGVVFVFAMAAARDKDINASLLQTMRWIGIFAVFGLLALDLSVRWLLAWYARRAKQLVESIMAFRGILNKFNAIYENSINVVKRAELASRGFQIGADWLPPIGRLEASDAGNASNDECAAFTAAKIQMRCVPLRRMLRKVNDQLLRTAFAIIEEGEELDEMDNGQNIDEDDTMDLQSPSLLLTALTKQHKRATIVLESAVHEILVHNLAQARTFRDNEKSGCLFSHFGSHRITVEKLITSLRAWTCDLETWNTTKDPVALFALDSGVSALQNRKTKSRVDDPMLESIGLQLQGLRSMSETLTALFIAAQYELLSTDHAIERLCNSRALMQSLIYHLQEEYNSYDSAFSSTIDGEKRQDISASKDVIQEAQCASNSTRSVTNSSVRAPEDPSCTVIFTGTSTGDESFDLLSLLKQQEIDSTAAVAKPTHHFVRELQNVLASRGIHEERDFTKQIDQDISISPTLQALHLENDAVAYLDKAKTNSLPPCVLPNEKLRQSLDPPLTSKPSGFHSPLVQDEKKLSGARANAFSLELQTLLQNSQQQSVECIGD
ncbi:hypothetical protein CCR75_005290 [Bremia lactucae]|uniref:Myosin-binding domain-containing protein n=1 Tax=Bremia lactucae TaxID=4779 RepID=A0A976IGE6_BRELC|nr:hypothetical protein CCR75_005290 [Bremia lactucae]